MTSTSLFYLTGQELRLAQPIFLECEFDLISCSPCTSISAPRIQKAHVCSVVSEYRHRLLFTSFLSLAADIIDFSSTYINLGKVN